MSDTTVLPPKVADGFWVEYSKHISGIKTAPFELEEIERVVSTYGDVLDKSIAWNDNGELRKRLLDVYRDALIIRTHRSAMLEQLKYALR